VLAAFSVMKSLPTWGIHLTQATPIGGVPRGGGRGIGRIRMRRIPDASAGSLHAFVQDTITPGTRVHTDGWHGYNGLTEHGYPHRVTLLRGDHELASVLLPRVHRVVALRKRWLLGTHQGTVSSAHLDDDLVKSRSDSTDGPLGTEATVLPARGASRRRRARLPW
jgi:hypothetical protein